MIYSSAIKDIQLKFFSSDKFDIYASSLYIVLSVRHASEDKNLIFEGLVIFLILLMLFLFFDMTAKHLPILSVCLFNAFLCFATYGCFHPC